MEAKKIYTPEEVASIRREFEELNRMLKHFEEELMPAILSFLPIVQKVTEALKATGYPVRSFSDPKPDSEDQK